MFKLEQFLIIVFVLFSLTSFVILLVIRYNRKRIEHGDELDQKDTEKDIAIKQTAFETQEAEKKRIGEDLHDDIGPQLAFMKLQLEMYNMKHSGTNPELEELSKQLKDAIKHVREVSHDLVPAVLFELGLATALKSISRRLDNLSHLQSDVIVDADLPPMEKKKELVIYRIVQESVTNAIKHADCSRIDIHLTVENNQVVVKVIDDGVGIAATKGDSNGLGMTNMRDRAAAYNGSIDLHSTADSGTEILLRLPI